MLRFKVGDEIRHGARYGRVTATSGTDCEVIVHYKDGGVSKWLPQDALVLQAKPEAKPEASTVE